VKQYIILALIATAYLVVSEMDYRDQVAAQSDRAQKCGALLSTVFNGGPLLDRNTDTAYFFDKPTAVRLNK
jgi:hypothetical protein